MAEINTMTNAMTARVSPLATVKAVATDEACQEHSFNGLALSELPGRAVVQLFAKRGREAAVGSALGIGHTAGLATTNERLTAMPLAPGQWILTSTDEGNGSFAAQLTQELGDDGYVSEQSHGRVIIRVSGHNARSLMQKGCRLDLHPSVATAGFCAQTSMAQVGVLIHQIDDEPTYDLHIYSGFALSFWHWLTSTAAQFGEG